MDVTAKIFHKKTIAKLKYWAQVNMVLKEKTIAKRSSH